MRKKVFKTRFEVLLNQHYVSFRNKYYVLQSKVQLYSKQIKCIVHIGLEEMETFRIKQLYIIDICTYVYQSKVQLVHYRLEVMETHVGESSNIRCSKVWSSTVQLYSVTVELYRLNILYTQAGGNGDTCLKKQ